MTVKTILNCDQDIIAELIRNCCPCNWGDHAESAKLWLQAEHASGEPLPDPDYWANADARKRLSVPPPQGEQS